jgi:hypothetical protein
MPRFSFQRLKTGFAQRTGRALLGTPTFKLAWLYKTKRWVRTENTENTEEKLARDRASLEKNVPN